MPQSSFFRRGITIAATTALTFSLAVEAQAAIVDKPWSHSAADARVALAPIGAYDSGVFDASAAEIVDYHAASKRLLVVNAQSGQIDVLDASDPTNPTKIGALSGGADTTINSVSVRTDGLGVATVEPANKTDAGQLMFFDAGAESL